MAVDDAITGKEPTMSILVRCAALMAVAVVIAPAGRAHAQTGFAYQGRVKQGGTLITGTADFRFSLFAGAVGGSALETIFFEPGGDESPLTVTDGLFSAQLDFDDAHLDGSARWLEIQVRYPSGGGAFTTVTPRQPVSAVPYAIHAYNGGNSGESLWELNGSDIFTASNVGIGIATPGTKLQVQGVENDGGNASLKITTNTDGAFLLLDSNEIDCINGNLVLNGNTLNGVYIAAGGGNVRIGSTATPNFPLHVQGGAHCTGADWVSVSSREAKEHFEPVDSMAVLEQVARLPISTWNYRDQPDEVRHLGPMAEDFHDAFGLMGSDTAHLSALDAAGVALSAAQALRELAREQEGVIERQRAALAAQKQRIDTQQVQIDQLAARLAQLEGRLSDGKETRP
jgi:uncharacterized coiled-coil protein SlyX